MLKLPDYLICENKSALPGAGLILCTSPPFFFGKVWLCHSEEYYYANMSEWINNRESLPFSKIEGYWITIVIAGSLENVNVASYKDVLQGIVDGMAQLYLEEKVSQKTGFYRKYLER